MFLSIRTYFPLLLVTCVAALGCTAADSIPTEPVLGLVTLDGDPVAGATITFHPNGPEGAAASGLSDENGNYRITVVQAIDGKQAAPGSGTLPGKYTVTVRKVETEEFISQEEAEEQGIPYQPSDQSPAVTYIVPKEYSKKDESGIEVEVKKGSNDIPLVLESK